MPLQVVYVYTVCVCLHIMKCKMLAILQGECGRAQDKQPAHAPVLRALAAYIRGVLELADLCRCRTLSRRYPSVRREGDTFLV